MECRSSSDRKKTIFGMILIRSFCFFNQLIVGALLPIFTLILAQSPNCNRHKQLITKLNVSVNIFAHTTHQRISKQKTHQNRSILIYAIARKKKKSNRLSLNWFIISVDMLCRVSFTIQCKNCIDDDQTELSVSSHIVCISCVHLMYVSVHARRTHVLHNAYD